MKRRIELSAFLEESLIEEFTELIAKFHARYDGEIDISMIVDMAHYSEEQIQDMLIGLNLEVIEKYTRK